MNKTLDTFSIVVYLVVTLILTTGNAFPESLGGAYSNPTIEMNWEIMKVSESRIQLTGKLRNINRHDMIDIDLSVRTLNAVGESQATTRFRFKPLKVEPDTVMPFGMMIDIPNVEYVKTIEFNIYYGSVIQDQTILPQFIQYSWPIRNKL
jgi:hypothetical protein